MSYWSGNHLVVLLNQAVILVWNIYILFETKYLPLVLVWERAFLNFAFCCMSQLFLRASGGISRKIGGGGQRC